MSVSGEYDIHYSWGCNNSYVTNIATFNTDGTFGTDDGGSGRWSQTNAYIIWRYDGDSAIYAGTVSGGTIVGSMVNFKLKGSGCFYATPRIIQALTADAVDYDSSGAQTK